MILQALTSLYDDLLKRGEISRPGWNPTKVGYALCLDENGLIQQFLPMVQEVQRGNKTVIENRSMVLPAAVKRTVGIAANFLWDNSSYILGIDNKGKPERSKDCYNACAKLHKELLSDATSKTAKAILHFFESWNPEHAEDCAAFVQCKEELLAGSNIVFRVDGTFASEDPEIAAIWQNHYDNAVGESVRCLITGEEDILEIVHPSLKGVKDAQSSGAALVSYNADAFCSFGKEQGANAPIGKKAAFAYTTALNHLLADRDNVQHIGDATVVCWAEGAEPQYQSLSLCALFGQSPPEGMDENDLHAAVKRLAEGLPCDDLGLRPEKPFYILGLSPNAARISVRFFYRSTFGELMKNVNDHQDRLKIVGRRPGYLALWSLLYETINTKSSDKTPSPVLSGAVMRSIYSGAPYPAGLLEATMLRIRAERKITPGRAAIIKAYYTKNENLKCPKEVLTVSLNESSTNIPYTLGRLFAVYEAAQESANPGINATIRDKYFNSASSAPSRIFPLLNKLYQKHLRKMDVGKRVYYEKQVGALSGILGEQMPVRLSLPEQGAFQLGYYHQQQKRYEKKEN